MSLYQAEKDGNVDALVGYLTRSGNDSIRERAADLLRGFGEDERAVSALIGAVEDDGSVAVRAAAVDSLDAIGIDALMECIEAIAAPEGESEGGADWIAVDRIAPLVESPDPAVRMVAAGALGRLDEPRAVPVLTGALSDPEVRVRSRVARSCGVLEHPQAIGPLESALDDEAMAVRREAARALGRIGTDRALAALLSRSDEPDETVRYVVVGALGECKRREAIEALADALADPSAPVRRRAVLSIVELLSTASASRSQTVREAVAETLSPTDEASVLDPLIDILESGDGPARRRNAAWLLGHLAGETHTRRVVDGLLELLGDDDQRSAQVATTSLVSIGGQSVEQRLLTFALDGRHDENARAKAVFALGQLGSERTRDRLDRLIETTDSEAVRRQAFSAVAKLDTTEEH